MICDDDFYAGKCPARKEDGRCVSKFPCSHKVEPPKPPTNADRIRAMSDEELRNWLFQRDCKNIVAFLQHGGAGVMDAVQLLGWLQQPAEEDHHDSD